MSGWENNAPHDEFDEFDIERLVAAARVERTREDTREHSPLWIATFAAFIARGWGTRDALVATDRALELIREADEEMPA